MAAYIVRRVLQGIVVLWLVSVITFGFEHLLPGGPAHAMLGQSATTSNIAHFNKVNGLDQPLPVQYLKWANRALHGDFGTSLRLATPVSTLIRQALPKSIALGGLTILFSVLIAIPIGLLQAIRRYGILDYALTAVSFVFYSMPVFWLALILVSLFAVRLHWLPAQAPQGDSVATLLRQWKALILPVLTLTLVIFAAFSRYIRSSTLENLTQDYVRTALAKGVSTPRLLTRHVMRNALAPVITLLGFLFPFIVSGAVIIESIFNYPGMGLLFYNSALTQDYPVLVATTLFVGAFTITGSLLADITYALVDPRVRYTKR
jgi:peptide/nickel transport system permease protein